MDHVKRIRRVWGYNETLAFLESYSARKDEFELSRKKKYAYANVLMDLEKLGVLEGPTTVEMLEGRMNSLLRGYKASIDDTRTGVVPCIAPFMEEMEEIFGFKPIMKNINGTPVDPIICIEEYSEDEECEWSSPQAASTASAATSAAISTTATSAAISTAAASNTRAASTFARATYPSAAALAKRKKSTPRLSYQVKKISLLQKHNNMLGELTKTISRNHRESENVKEKRQQGILDLIREFLGKK